jgi:hypothetical protein
MMGCLRGGAKALAFWEKQSKGRWEGVFLSLVCPHRRNKARREDASDFASFLCSFLWTPQRKEEDSGQRPASRPRLQRGRLFS